MRLIHDSMTDTSWLFYRSSCLANSSNVGYLETRCLMKGGAW